MKKTVKELRDQLLRDLASGNWGPACSVKDCNCGGYEFAQWLEAASVKEARIEALEDTVRSLLGRFDVVGEDAYDEDVVAALAVLGE